MKLRFTPRATEDLLEIGIYFSTRDRGAGQRVRAVIYEGLQTLLLFPHGGRLQKLGQVRKFYYVADESAR